MSERPDDTGRSPRESMFEWRLRTVENEIVSIRDENADCRDERVAMRETAKRTHELLGDLKEGQLEQAKATHAVQATVDTNATIKKRDRWLIGTLIAVGAVLVQLAIEIAKGAFHHG